MLPPFLRYLPKQFGVLSALRLAWVELNRRLFDPAARLSYSSAGEDIVLRHIFQHQDGGYFVDVGCNHPDYTSNTMALYKMGWRGVCIDANQALIKKQRQLRPRDQQVFSAVSDSTGTAQFTAFQDCDQLGSIAPDYVAGLKHRTDQQTNTVPAQRLTDILQQCQTPQHFDLLSIDVEGHDWEVLQSLDFELFRPRVIVLEMLPETNSNVLASALARPETQWLQQQGYQLFSLLLRNGYFYDLHDHRHEQLRLF